MGVLHFDPKDILRENEVGLWMMRIKEDEKRYELHVDETMEKVLASNVKLTSTECYKYWFSKIHPDSVKFVEESLLKMVKGKKSVQVEFSWCHPTLGDVIMRFSGKRVNDSNGMIVLEGYSKIVTNVTGV
jgi:hypothetical protein